MLISMLLYDQQILKHGLLCDIYGFIGLFLIVCEFFVLC